jgi:4-amino-4-deoxy-L-arabinose transferase-like glycosyltransferase
MEIGIKDDCFFDRTFFKKALFGIIAFAFFIRISGMIALQSWEADGFTPYGFRDGEIGSALAAGQGFSWPDNSSYNQNKLSEPTAWQAPVYPLIIAAVFKFFGTFSVASRIVLLVFQIFISVLMCGLLLISGKKIFNLWVGLFAALMLVFYPPALHLTIDKISSSNLFVCLLLLFILQCVRVDENPTGSKSIVAGFIFGIAALTDPVILALLPFALGWLIFKSSGELKKRITSSVLICLALCMTISPWQIRNYLVFDQLFLIKSNFSRELFIGNFASDKSSENEKQYQATLDEGERDRIYLEKSLDSIQQNPTLIVHKIYGRILLYWTDLPRRSTINVEGLKELAAGISYLFLLVLGVAGICLSVAKSRKSRLLFLVILSMPIPYYLTWFTHFRYRFPIEPALMVFAGYSIFYFWKLLRDYRQRLANSI